MQSWAVNIKFVTARGLPADFDAVIPAIGAKAATEAAEAKLARARRGYRIRQIATREIKECAS